MGTLSSRRERPFAQDESPVDPDDVSALRALERARREALRIEADDHEQVTRTHVAPSARRKFGRWEEREGL